MSELIKKTRADLIRSTADKYDLARHADGLHPLGGDIRPGMIFIWEPLLDHAIETIIVTRVETEPEGGRGSTEVHHATGVAVIWAPRGTLIWTRALQIPDGCEVHNTESRFREACVRTLLNDQDPVVKRGPVDTPLPRSLK